MRAGKPLWFPCSCIMMERVMTNTLFLVTLAEMEVAFRFHLSGTGMLFRSYKHKYLTEENGRKVLSVEMDRIRAYSAEQNCTPELAEFFCLMDEAADYLAEHGCTMFHGVAFSFGEGAYILTAPSGTGKSTQYRNMRTLFGPRISIINGDKPILGYASDGGIIVYPSPWTGKEGWAGTEQAPLHGLILLEQGRKNLIQELDRQAAALPVIEEFIYRAKTRQGVHSVCRMADRMLRTVPLYRFINRGDAASSALLFEHIMRIEESWQLDT